jgi:hypothetical protein
MRGSYPSRNQLVFILALFFLIESPIGARDALSQASVSGPKEAFDTVTLTVQAAGGAALGSFADLWEVSPALRLDVTTPLNTGVARVGVDVFDHRALSPAVPDFGCVHAWLGWAYRWELLRHVSCASGLEVGVSYMMFDDEATARAREEETELTFGVSSQVAYAWTPTWSLVLHGRYQKVLTQGPIEHVFVGMGLGRRFATPRWLREFLD